MRPTSDELGSILHHVKEIPRALHEGHVDPYIRYVSILPEIHASSTLRNAANALPPHRDEHDHVGDERVQKIERTVADVLL
uniref:Uncharacterized protein n=1 Tax=Caenorhabditis japonica TaxID=281687 RepID=A0A8R1ED11_CAEJA